MPVTRLAGVSNWSALLQEVRDVLDSTGDWTIHVDMGSPSEGAAAGGKELVASNDDCLVGLRSTDSGNGANRLWIFDGIPPYTGSPTPSTLPGNSGVHPSTAEFTSATEGTNARRTNPAFAGPFPTAFIFTDNPSTYCHVVAETVSGRYRHICFGNMRKFGAWTGGAYYAHTFWDQTAAYIDLPRDSRHATPFDWYGVGAGDGKLSTYHYNDGSAQVWRATNNGSIGGVTRRIGNGTVRSGFGRAFVAQNETPFSGMVALQPITVWANATGSTPVSAAVLGQIKDVAAVNMRNLEPGASYFIGVDEWLVFPCARKQSPTLQNSSENSGWFGMAYKVV